MGKVGVSQVVQHEVGLQVLGQERLRPVQHRRQRSIYVHHPHDGQIPAVLRKGADLRLAAALLLKHDYSLHGARIYQRKRWIRTLAWPGAKERWRNAASS